MKSQRARIRSFTMDEVNEAMRKPKRDNASSYEIINSEVHQNNVTLWYYFYTLPF